MGDLWKRRRSGGVRVGPVLAMAGIVVLSIAALVLVSGCGEDEDRPDPDVAPLLMLEPGSGVAGEEVTVTGMGFSPQTEVLVFVSPLGADAERKLVERLPVSEEGRISGGIRMPEFEGATAVMVQAVSDDTPLEAAAIFEYSSE